MKNEKQIEEMAKHCHFYEDGNCTLCEELWVACDIKCDMCEFAKRLYNAGYRKASDIAREMCRMLREDLRGFVDADYLERLLTIYEKKYESEGEG